MQRTITPIARRNDHEANYSSFDFAPELSRKIAGDTEPVRGLFFLHVDGVRPRTDDDGEIDLNDPDPKWIALGGDGFPMSHGIRKMTPRIRDSCSSPISVSW
jgi:hypothetical protein